MSRTILLLPFTLVLIFPSTFLIGQEPAHPATDEVKTVESSGTGTDRNEALRQALRTAVEQAIGIFLKSKTVVENYELLSDRILSHSRGFVKTFEIISEGRQGGLYQMTVSADVVIKELENTLVEMKLFSREVEGETLFGKAFTKIESRKSGAALYADLRQTLITKAIAVEFAEVEVQSVEGDSATIVVPFNLIWDQAFLIDLQEVLEQTCEVVATTRVSQDQYNRQYKPSRNQGYSRIDVNDEYHNPGAGRYYPGEKTSYFVKEIFAKSFAEGLRSHRRGGGIFYELQLILTAADGVEVFSKTVRRGTQLFGFSRSEINGGYKISQISVNKHVKPDWQRKQNSTYTTIKMHVDQLQAVRDVTGILKF